MRAVPDSDPESDDHDGQESASTRSSGRAPAQRPLNEALLSSARHEVGSPLQTIQGFAELLESQVYGPLSQEQLSFVGHILQGSTELGAVLDACIEIAQLELLGRERDPRRVTGAALRDALDRAAAAVGVPVTSAVDEAAGELGLLDIGAVERAFSALVLALSGGNAGSKHALEASIVRERERVRVCVCVARRSSGGGALLSVRELAARRRSSRHLIWLRLADVLLAAEEASLLVGAQVDQAEVCIRLSSAY